MLTQGMSSLVRRSSISWFQMTMGVVGVYVFCFFRSVISWKRCALREKLSVMIRSWMMVLNSSSFPMN